MNLDEKYDILMFKFPDERGTLHCTKIYNLNVLNHLAMVELDNEKLNSIANEFGENIVQRKELVNGDQRYVPYYTPRTYEVLAKRLEDDNKYLRQY